MPILNDKEYECDFCHGIFGLVRDETWNEEFAKKEYEYYFPGESWNNREVVCDDCWNKVKPKI